MSGWLEKTRVVDGLNRRGTVLRPGNRPFVAWDDGTRTDANGDLLTRAPDDWFSRAVEDTEQM